MFSSSSPRLTLLAFVAGATTAFLLLVLTFQQWENARWERTVRTNLEQSAGRSRAVADYLNSLRDLETGQRGLLVTDDPAFLQPFTKALQELPDRKAKIQSVFANTVLATLAGELVAKGSARTERALKTVESYQKGERLRALDMVAEGTGKRLMDQARFLAKQLETAEVTSSRAFLSTTLAERRARQRSVYITEVAGLLSLVVLFFALSRIVGNLRRSSIILTDMATRQTAIFDSATDGMMMLDEQGLIESINPAMEMLFGYAKSDLVGKSNLVLFRDPPSTDASEAYLRRLAAGNVPDRRQMFEGTRADGTTIEAEVVTTPVRLADGLHFLAVLRDATERREIERMKEEFVATVSHELRTPLTSIAGSLGLISGGAGGKIDEKARRLVDIARSNSDRLIRLINDMLDIEKIASGKAVFDFQSVDLAAAIEGVLAQIEPFAQQHSTIVHFDNAAEGAAVIADPDRLAQVLTNLLSNAIKFSPEGSVVRARASVGIDGKALVSVQDQGPGIAPEFQKKIFQKFAQADSTDSRQKGGTGLGLSIVKELVERMGGAISFVSEEGEGATFTFDLPTVPRIRPHMVVPERLGRLEESDRAQILHVDDDADTLRLVASAFEGRAAVHSSPSLAEALASVERYSFDAIILDVAMPDGNGLELVEFLKQNGQSGVPVILYTALDATSLHEPQAFARIVKSKATLNDLVEVAEKALALKGGNPADA